MEDSPFWLKILRDPVWQFVGALLALAVPLVSWWWFSRKKEKCLTYELGVIVPSTLAGPLFTRITKGGRIRQERLSDQGIYHTLDTRRQQANMAPFTPDDLRRTFAGDLLDAGVDLSTVQKLMDHANANTTSGYDRRGAP